MKQQNEMNDVNEASVKTKLVPVTVRFSPVAYEQMKKLADEFGVSFGTVARLTVDGNLAEYLSTVRYIDKKQASVINKNIVTVGNQIQSIKNDLHRIGVNYNQELKLKHIQAKYDAKREKVEGNKYLTTLDRVKMMMDFDKEQQQETDVVTADNQNFSAEQVIELLEKFEQAANDLGVLLWHIQE